MARSKSSTEPPPGPSWTLDIEPAPGELRIVQAFLSTAPAGESREVLTDPQTLADWLVAWTLLQPGTELGEDDLLRVHGVRAGLVGLARANSGTAFTAAARARLDRTLASVSLRPRFTNAAVLRFEPASTGLDGALGRLLDIVASAHHGGHWRRFKVCDNTTCRQAFYDLSRNVTGRWCRPRCGNTLNARAARKRRGRLAAATALGRR